MKIRESEIKSRLLKKTTTHKFYFVLRAGSKAMLEVELYQETNSRVVI